jgi:spindle assembly abnormal protein 6
LRLDHPFVGLTPIICTDVGPPFRIGRPCRLKQNQDIKVGFAAFPQNVVELLDLCASADEPKYQAELVVPANGTHTELATLNLIETNSFKNLVHLSLTVAPGSETDVKTYLAICLTAQKTETVRLQAELDETTQDSTTRLEAAAHELQAKTHEIAQMKEDLAATIASMQAKHAKELADIREKGAQTEAEGQARFVKDEQERATQEAMRAGSAETTIQQLTQAHAVLNQTKVDLENERRDLKSKHRTAEETSQSLQRDLDSYREQLLTLESSKLVHEAAIADSDARLLTLSTQLEASVERGHEQSVIIATAQGELDFVQQKCATLEAQTSVLRHETDLQKRDAAQGHAKVAGMEVELKSVLGKTNLKNEVIVRQERAIEKRQHELNSSRETQSRLEQANMAITVQLDQTTLSLSQTQTELEEKTRLLKNSENVITWLNRQLNTAGPKARTEPKSVDLFERPPLAPKSASDMNTNNVHAVAYRRTKDTASPGGTSFGDKYLSSDSDKVNQKSKSRIPQLATVTTTAKQSPPARGSPANSFYP